MEGIIQPQYPFAVKRFVQYLELPSDADAIREYRRLHSKEGHWPEIVRGIREVGILEMDLYIVGNHLVMIVVASADFDWDKAMARLATLPRQAEWEDTVGRLQGCKPGATSDEKWQMMERFFHLYE